MFVLFECVWKVCCYTPAQLSGGCVPHAVRTYAYSVLSFVYIARVVWRGWVIIIIFIVFGGVFTNCMRGWKRNLFASVFRGTMRTVFRVGKKSAFERRERVPIFQRTTDSQDGYYFRSNRDKFCSWKKYIVRKPAENGENFQNKNSIAHSGQTTKFLNRSFGWVF